MKQVVETKNVRIDGVPFEVDVLDEQDFDDGERVEVEMPDGTLVRSVVNNSCQHPTIFDPFVSAWRRAYITYSPNGIEVSVRISGLRAERL